MNKRTIKITFDKDSGQAKLEIWTDGLSFMVPDLTSNELNSIESDLGDVADAANDAACGI